VGLPATAAARGEKESAAAAEELDDDDTPSSGRSRAGRYDATTISSTTLAHATAHSTTGEEVESALDRRDDSRPADTPRRDGGGNICDQHDRAA
jgi:hypothetical protein